MYTSPLEFLAEQMGNVVKYDAQGRPSVFVPFYKVKSSELDPSLPNRTHPAFIVNGQEVSRILIGKYMGSELELNGTLYSLPNMPPRRSLGFDQLDQRVKQFPGAVQMTAAMHGLILLLAKKNGWVPKGNTYYSVDHRDGTPWNIGTNATVDMKRVLYGWEYTCLIAHATVAELKPDIAPNHWRRGRFIGGNTVITDRTSVNGRGYNTMTGSGPLSWNLDGKAEGLTDVVGGVMENLAGFRVFDGELQIFADNDAAHPAADFSAGSGAWKAILPSMVDDGHTLVLPGTPGTLKWNGTGVLTSGYYTPQLDTQISLRTTGSDYLSAMFKDLTAEATRVPFVPAILRELGIFPIVGDATQGRVYYNNQAGTEYFPRRGGYCSSTSSAGMGCVHCSYTRGHSSTYYGARPAFVEL